MKFGLIIKPAAWLYGEDLKYAVDELFMGWAVEILEERDDWCRIVTHYGYEGYLEKKSLRSCTAEELTDRDKRGQTIFVKRAQADIMAEPDVHSEVLCTLERGSFLSALPEMQKACHKRLLLTEQSSGRSLKKIQNGYRKVLLSDGRTGYIPDIAYSRRKENDRYLYEGRPEKYFLRQQIAGRYLEKERFETWFRKRLVVCAKAYLGTQYRWAGKSAQGIDCSGLVFMCYLMNGILIYRDAEIKEGYPMREIPIGCARPGDLLYFPGHVAMYLGNRKYIHATGNAHSFGCVVNSLSAKDLDFREDLAEAFLMAGSIM